MIGQERSNIYLFQDFMNIFTDLSTGPLSNERNAGQAFPSYYLINHLNIQFPPTTTFYK